MLRLSIEQVDAIVAHALTDAPKEACGLIAGKAEKATSLFPIKNAAANSQSHYQMDATELLRAYKSIEADGLDCIAIYHSHPKSEPLPSQEDVHAAELNTPNTIHLIVSLKPPKARLQAWRIQPARQADKVELLIGTEPSQNVPKLSQLQVWSIILATVFAVLLLLAISFSLLPPAPPIPSPQ
jgi:[CysO sulfur-carrier protein]-S-L-cysteine hydrolase